MTAEEPGDYIKENWNSIRGQIRQREYYPQPARRVEIPKPNGGVRKPGMPTVMDRVIQQGIVQAINPMCEPLFPKWGYGLRPESHGWIQRKLGLRVNMTKTHITRPIKRKYLGFGFYKDSKAKEWGADCTRDP